MKSRLVERALVGILLIIFGGIVIHAPLSVGLGTIWPAQDLIIKAWKELLMGVALVLFIIEAVRHSKVNQFLSDRLMQLALVYAGLHLVMIGLFSNNLDAVGAGLLIDLRYILYFVLVYGTLRLFPSYRRLFITVFIGGAVVVLGFSLLQLFVLPTDILASIGYSKATIAPYLTVDENPLYIRINSTLRGPNPLGAYMVIVASILMALAFRWKLGKKGWWLTGSAAIAAGLALGASHSRSSFIAMVAAIATVIVIASPAKIRKLFLVGVSVSALIILVGLFALRNVPIVANLVFHDNPTTGAHIDSNTGHLNSLVDGTDRMLRQPFGAGIGSTGSASLLGDQPMIIENQYLLIAHEVGWIGLIIFIWLFVLIMKRLLQGRKSALALGTFGAGIGLFIIGLLLPVWTDDTVSIIWWGLAAIAIGGVKHAKRKSN